MEQICAQCHVSVKSTDFFCYNCGKNLKPKPLSTSVGTLGMYYVGAILLPPMGFIWGWRYVKESDPVAKTHGIILIILTAIELIYLTFWTMNFFQTINATINSQLKGVEGF